MSATNLENEAMHLSAVDLLQKAKIFEESEDKQSEFMTTLLFVLARVSIAVFALYVFVRTYFRRMTYAIERATIFRKRTPQQIRQDVAQFPKIPRHVAFILESIPAHSAAGATAESPVGPDAVLDNLFSCALQTLTWTVGAGAQQLTLYERSGLLQQLPLDKVAEALSSGLAKHVLFSDLPSITVRSGTQRAVARNASMHSTNFTVTLESEQDGRPVLVNLANEYARKIAQGQLTAPEITVDKVHTDIITRIGDEPDLLVTFGSHLDLARFSPWLLRVTELYCLEDNNDVFHYMVFYKALEKFAGVKVNLGA